jgi:thiol-disulfide isomerase/thioredoxin
MKKILFLLLLPATLWGIQTPEKTVRLECNLFDVPQNVDSIILYDLQGLASVPIKKAGLTEDKKYIFTVPKGPAKIYGVGVSELNVAKIILGEEDVVVLWANAKFMNKARTMGSDANAGLEKTLSRLQEFSDVDEAMLNEMKENTSGPIPDLYERAKQNQDAKMEFLDSLKKTNAMLHQIAGLFVHPSPFAMKKVPDSPVIYFGEHYFDNVKLNDAAFDNNPFVYDAFEELTTKLFERNCSDERAGIIVKKHLDGLQTGSNRHRMALGGAITGFKSHGPLYIEFSQQYLAAYSNSNRGEISRLSYEVSKASVQTIGMIPPDLEGKTPEGEIYSLYKMRGNVVLIDFWASWCGPCRRENPNVKKVYEKYHDKGFDILGVSLDREPVAWKKAIAADGLPWHHISDLKGWQSEHAKLYSIRSIPATILVDREGKILARNLRGEQLGEKLKEIFGE